MTPKEVISIIEEKGKFVYSPLKWTEETDESLDKLLANDIIATDLSNEMNPDYMYIFCERRRK